MRRLLDQFARWTAGLLAGLAVLVLLGYGVLLAAGYRPVAVYSGSMEPTLGVGSLAVVKPVPADELQVGDVITFSHPYLPGRLVTHRIVEIAPRGDAGGRAFRTKGDANPRRDPWAVALPGDAGRVSFEVPFAGYAFVYLKTREARTALLVAVALFVLIGLLRRIWSVPTAPAGKAA